jgi:PEGA domain-containing protein
MLVAPGTYQIKVALPGYHTFETNINLLANQKVEIKTDLAESSAPPAGP